VEIFDAGWDVRLVLRKRGDRVRHHYAGVVRAPQIRVNSTAILGNYFGDEIVVSVPTKVVRTRLTQDSGAGSGRVERVYVGRYGCLPSYALVLSPR